MKTRGLFVSVFFLSTFTLFCQVKIKEKIEIRTGINTNQGLKKSNNGKIMDELPCEAHLGHDDNNFYQVVWSTYWGSLDPSQQLFNLQDSFSPNHKFLKYDWGGFPYAITVVEGRENCRIEKLVPNDDCGSILNCWKWVDLETDSLVLPYFYIHGGIPDSEHVARGDTTYKEVWILNGVPHLEPCYYRITYFGSGNVTLKYVPMELIDSVETYLYFHTIILMRNFYITGNQTNQLEHGHKFGLGIKPETDQCTNNDFEAGGWIPPETRFNIEITEGSEYGTLKFENTQDNWEGAFFNDIDEGDLYCLNFLANGAVPDTAGFVKILVTPSEQRIAPLELTLRVVQNHSDDYPISVKFNSSQICPGDTVDIILKKRNFDGTYSSFDEDQTFNVELVKGENYGTLLCENDTSDYFFGYEQPFKFIASKSINTDSVAAWIKVTTMISSGQMDNYSIKRENKSIKNKLINAKRTKFIDDASSIYKNKKGKSNTEITKETTTLNKPSIITQKKKVTEPKTNLIIIGGGDEEIYGWGKAVIKQYKILLGDTKYFQAKLRNDTLTIVEIRPNADGIPQQRFGVEDGWQWLTSDVWGNNPVSIIDCDNHINRMGVYWEKQKPMRNGQNLPIGLIRLVGRYWNKDSIYVVKLKAKTENGLSTGIAVKVTKPNHLITGNPQHTYELTNDVFGRPLNIDSLCIVFAGNSGIPPQIIKGQMYKESYKENYRFHPTYRYEPFSDLDYQNNPRTNRELFGSPNCFVVTRTSMGTGNNIPDLHNNVHPIDYPRNPINMNIFLSDNIWEYIQRSTRRVFYRHRVAGLMNKYLTDRYNLYVKQNQNDRRNFDMAVSDLADKCRIGGFFELIRIAQTRIVASYGFLQQTHYDAAEPRHNFNGFTRTATDHNPELLNEQEYNMLTYIERMNFYTRDNEINLSGFNWYEGFESRWERALRFYNPLEAGYQTDVLRNSLMFLPR